MNKVLLIGANSYIGQEFNCFIFNNYKEIVSLTMVSASNNEWESIDFSEYHTVMHLSALVHKKEKKEMESDYYNINYKLAVVIAEKAKANNIKQFIFFSTAAVFDAQTICVKNESIPNPSTFYGKSKLAAENVISAMSSDEFQVAILRIPMVYGDGCKGNYQRLVRLAKYTLIFPEYHNRRSVLHINKLCEFLIDIIINGGSGFLYPQDEKYMDTCQTIVEIRKKWGKKTYLTKKFNLLIRKFLPHSNTLIKMFSDFYYDID